MKVLDLLAADGDEVELQIERWNATARPFPADRGVHELIRRQVRTSPDALAVICEDDRLTYSEVDALARRLAADLREAGVRPGMVVAIGLQPSAARIAAVLGVLYSGAAYLPLDLESPAGRVEFMVRDSAAAALVTDAAPGEDRLRSYEGPVLRPDDLGPAAGVPEFPGAELPAYVIYTSGSTGRPKAVMIKHRGLVNRLEWMRRGYAVQPADRILHKTSFGFDVSVWEQLLALCGGAAVVVAPAEARRDMTALVRLIRAEGVTMLHFVPSLLPPFLETPETAGCTSLRTVVCSGEALPKPMAVRFGQVLPDCALHNLYGPTEATIDVTSWAVDPADARAHVPIGRPIDNTRMYVLDEALRPLPIGAEGELYIGGEGVAIGYLGRPGLTAERFVPDPWGEGTRLYATGDRARFGPDGAIEFLGRRDHQVKLRGYRIELGEIESALLEAGDVRQAVVVTRGPESGRRLVAYVAGAGHRDPDAATESLLAALGRRLPDYMVPAQVVWLDRLPVTTAGKVDRAALPEPEHTTHTGPEPATDVQKRIAEIWADLLDTPVPGIDADFFHSGGDSVSSMRLVARARREGVRIEVADVFKERTVRRMAEASAPVSAAEPAGGDEEALLEGIDPAQFAEVRRAYGAVDVYPLAPMQAGMLFRGLFWPASDAYFNQNVIELSGDVEEPALREAWRTVAERYEILRTGFVWSGLEEPLQYVMPDVEPPWTTLDWSRHPAGTHVERLGELLEEDRERGLSLDQCPLYRLTLVRRGPGTFYLAWSHHHILLDGWCLSLIWGDVFKVYEAIVHGRDHGLAPVRPFRDYVRWIRARRSREAESERFWRDYLRELTPAAFSAHPIDQDGPFDTIVRDQPAALTVALAACARKAGVTMNAVIQLVWAILLGLRSGTEDVVHGLTIAGRPPELEGSEQMVGLFINTLPLRTRLAGNPSLTELLRRVHDDLAATSAHGHVPLAQIKSWGPGARMAGGRIFDSLIAYENYPEDNLPADGDLSIGVTDLLAQEKTEYPIGLIVLPGERLSIHFNYDTTHFAAAEIDRIIATFELILSQVVERPQLRLRELEMLIEGDAEVIARSNDTAEEWPDRDAGVAGLFERRVAAAPAAPAVTEAGTELTYAELDEAAAGLAARLQAAGVGPFDLVGLCVPRSAHSVVALLAVYKAGAVPVLIDHSQPVERRRRIANDAAPRAVIAVDPDGLTDRPIVRPAERAERATLSPAPPCYLAYITYTSGSTGEPKGVVTTQSGLVNRLLWSVKELTLDDPPRLLWTGGQGFDISVWEILFPLLRGGTVVIAPERAVLDPDSLAELIAEEEINVVHLLPSLLSALLDVPAAARCRNLRHVVSGGEAVPPGLVRKFFSLGLPARLHQAYGPTEAAISVTHHTCEPADGLRARVPLGHPIGNTRLHVVDDHLRPRPIGAEGELAIAGTPLATGYLGRPGQTAGRFVPDPFGDAGGRLYLTGDRVRRLGDGSLEFLGRRDRQVKISGHRVEPAETEAVLEGHPAVRQAIAVPAGDRLVTFVVPAAGAGLELAELTRWARKRLPGWMTGELRELDTPPRTTNGKVDVGRLAALAEQRPSNAAAESVQAPRNEMERMLLACWEKVLGRGPLGVHDDFFDNGGHSMLVIRLLRLMRAALPAEVAVDVTQIFKAPTVAAMAEQLIGPVAGSRHIYTFNPQAGDPLFLVHAGEGLARVYGDLAVHLPGTRVHAFSNPRFGQAAGFSSIGEMATRYVGWVRTLQPAGPYRLGGWSFGGTVALEMAAQMRRHGDEVDLVLLIDSNDLSAHPESDDVPEGVRAHLTELGVDPESEEGKVLAEEMLRSGRLAVAHRPRPYEGRVVLLEAQGSYARRSWSPEMFPGLEVAPLAGTHTRLFDSDHLAGTAAVIAQVLREV